MSYPPHPPALRPRPHNVPPGARPPVSPALSNPTSSYGISQPPYLSPHYPQVQSPLPIQQSASLETPTQSTYYLDAPRSHLQSISAPPSPSWRHQQNVLSAYRPSAATMAFPEPNTSPTYRPTHRPSKSDSARASRRHSPQDSVMSFGSVSEESVGDDLPDLSALRLDTQDGILEGLKYFQSGRVLDKDAEWYRFVPKEAISSLDKHEVERQSVLFELIKGEKEYVDDLRLVSEVFIDGLASAQPPIIEEKNLMGFITQVFGSMDRILAHHQRQLAALFERQLDQHPLVQSISDIILDNALKFLPEYEAYIKNSPIALEIHRKELSRNPMYHGFIDRCASDPRVRRRDVKTLLSRPVTRLPRLKLVLERIQKVSAQGHPDLETLPLVLSVLGDFIRSTEPGIVVSESKVKFWDVCESLVYSRGEIIDLDLHNDERALVHTSPLARKIGHAQWADLVVVLLDHYLLLLKEEVRHGRSRRLIVSRPIPLEYLRLDTTSFASAPEIRRDREGITLLSAIASQKLDVFPFTIFHASGCAQPHLHHQDNGFGSTNHGQHHQHQRSYTLYANTASARSRWREELVNAIGVRRAKQDANLWFAPAAVNDGALRVVSTSARIDSRARLSGRVTAAATFAHGGRTFVAVGCTTGLYVGLRADESFKKVLPHASPESIIALQEFGNLLILVDGSLLAYSLSLLARVCLGEAPRHALDASCEDVAGKSSGTVLFFRAGHSGPRTIGTVMYATKGLIHVTLYTIEAVKPGETTLNRPQANSGSFSFRAFGSPCYVPRDAYDITFLHKSVGISTEKGIAVIDPTNLTTGSVNIVPDYESASNNAPMQSLKERTDATRVLGLVRVDANELLIVYEEIGCYIDRHGKPTRSSGYIRWESKATAFAVRGAHVLLFSPSFIEIRLIERGRLVIEGEDIRLLQRGVTERDALVIAMRGKHNDARGQSELVSELVQTTEIVPSTPISTTSGSIHSNSSWVI